jgi:muramoyltetrapeptide carboxypeptidase
MLFAKFCKQSRLIFYSCFLLGCAEERSNRPIPTEVQSNHSKGADKAINPEQVTRFHDVCRRIGRLNMTVTSVGSSLSPKANNNLRCLAQEWGINIPESALPDEGVFFFSDIADHRLNFLLDAINSDHKIIWSLRGGHGTEMFLSTLNRLPPPKKGKIFIGFCDATSLNLFITQKWPDCVAIHATMLLYLTPGSFDSKFDLLLDILEGKVKRYEVTGIHPLNTIAQKQKSVSGKLSGGNLTIIESSLKTCWEIETNNKILFLEDTNEQAPAIIRVLNHLKEAGKFSGVKAIIFGHFHSVKRPRFLKLCLKWYAETLAIPVYTTERIGHGDYNDPLVYNATASIRDGKMIVDIPEILQKLATEDSKK